MKYANGNMVAPLKSLELTAAQIIRIFIQTHNLEDGGWNLNAGTSRKCTTLNTSCQTNILSPLPHSTFAAFQGHIIIET